MTSVLVLRFFSVALVAVFVVCGFAAGSVILDRIYHNWKPSDRLLLAIPLGCGLLATVILALGAVGLLHPITLWGIVLAPGIAGWRHLLHLRAGIREAIEPLSGWSVLSGYMARAVFCAVAVLLLMSALPPSTDWDSLMYHLDIPSEFLRAARIFVPEDNLHVAFVGLWHMLYLPFLAVGASVGPALLNATFAILLGFAVLLVGERLFGKASAVLAFMAFWGSTAIILVAVTPRIDVTLAFFLLLTNYMLISAAEEQRGEKLVVAAILAGLSLGMKYHALIYLAALLPIAVWAVFRVSQVNRDRFRWIASCLLVVVVIALPWLMKNWVLLGGPMYPLFAERLLPPWLAELAGGRRLPAGVAPETFQVLAHARQRFSLTTLLLDPASLTVEAEGRAFTISPAILLVPFALVYARHRPLMMLLAPGAGYILLLTVASDFINLRYLIPALAPLVLVAAEATRRLGRRLERNWCDALLLAAFLSLLPAARAARAELLTPQRIRAAIGILSTEDYLVGSRTPGFSSYYSATHWVSEYTRPGDQVLLLFEARGFYFDRDVLQDNDLTNWPLLLATGSPRRCLRDSSITHVLVNHGAAGYYQRRGSDLNDMRWDAFPEFAGRCTEIVHARSHYVLLRLRKHSVGATLN